MKNRYKPHLLKLERKRTSVGRDLTAGLRLDRNERVTDFPECIIRDIYSSMPKYIFSAYPDSDKLYEKSARWLKIPRERIYITNAITEAIRIVFETLVSPGDHVVSIYPTFPMYKIYAEIYQARLHNVGFLQDLSLNIRELYESINSDTCLVCLPNPNLPIETALSLEQIKKIAVKCKDCGTVLVLDEAYYFFGAPTAIGLVQEFDNLVILRTFSKAFGLAGARLGYMVSNEENIEYLSKTRSLVESNAFSLFVGEFMLDHPEIMKTYIKEVSEGAAYVKKELDKLGFRWLGGSVTNGMLIFLRDNAEAEDLLSTLRKDKIYLRGSFDEPIKHCVRLTIGPEKVMKRFIFAFSNWAKNRK